MDAIWSKRSKDVQMIEVIVSEIFEILEAPDDDYVPRGIAKNMKTNLERAPEDQREGLRLQMLELPHHKKKTKILELFDILKQYLDGERLVEITNKINEEMRKKLVTGVITQKDMAAESSG